MWPASRHSDNTALNWIKDYVKMCLHPLLLKTQFLEAVINFHSVKRSLLYIPLHKASSLSFELTTMTHGVEEMKTEWVYRASQGRKLYSYWWWEFSSADETPTNKLTL
jgi:hypothetical protein